MFNFDPINDRTTDCTIYMRIFNFLAEDRSPGDRNQIGVSH